MTDRKSPQLTYPETDRDRAICGAFLAIVKLGAPITSDASLDSLTLTTRPLLHRHLLTLSDRKAFEQIRRKVPCALVSEPGTSVHWKLCRDYLEKRRALSIDRTATEQVITPGPKFGEVAATLPDGFEPIAMLALKAQVRARQMINDLLKEDR